MEADRYYLERIREQEAMEPFGGQPLVKLKKMGIVSGTI